MDVKNIKDENALLKRETARLKTENARLASFLRDARDLVQRFEKETRPHSVPLDLPARGRLFSSSSASPDTNNFLRKCAESPKRKCSVSPEANDFLRKCLENPPRKCSVSPDASEFLRKYLENPPRKGSE